MITNNKKSSQNQQTENSWIQKNFHQGHDGGVHTFCAATPEMTAKFPLPWLAETFRTTILHRAASCWRAVVAQRVSVGTVSIRRGDA
jgi:hypothetical protein